MASKNQKLQRFLSKENLKISPQIRPSVTVKENPTNVSPKTKSFKSNKIIDLFTKNSRLGRRAALNSRLAILNSDADKLKVKEEWLIEETEKAILVNKSICIDDFTIIQTLGHGGFGVVRLVKEKKSGDIYAMKSLRKSDMLKRQQEAHVKAERDLLCQASQVADWIVRLIATFQDETSLYFVLEYMPGGDLLGLLIKLDIFPEDFAKHYCAEMVLAIEEVHKLGY